MKIPLRIVFYGNPLFAVPSLELLLKNNYNVIAVVTSPDKQAGRGLKFTRPDVKICAEKYGINILQPENLSDENFIEAIQYLKPELQIVIAFRKLPSGIWKAASSGTINLHPSLLPDYRGAAPVNRAIMNGEKETGLTTIFINDDIDCGDIILQEKVEIDTNDTAGSLHDRLSVKGAGLVLKTVELIASGNVSIIKQSYDKDFKKAPKIQKEDCRIKWSNDVNKIYNFIRGLSPFPGAWTISANKRSFKIFSSEMETITHNDSPGKISTNNKNFLKVASTDGYINVREIQIEGKKVLPVAEFLKGFKFESNSFFV